jgi:hypothetical protein
MKKSLYIIIALLVCGAVYATQDTSITTRQVRNPNELKTWLEANASDAESRLTSGSTSAATLPLINTANAGTCVVSMQADKADDAGDKTAMIGSDGAGILFQSDITSKGNLATKATITTAGLITTLVGIDAIGAVDFDIGSADVTDVTIVTDGGTIVLDGTANIPGVITAGSDITVAGDATITSNATVGGTLAVTGVATFTAESVHDGGIDADGITVDAGDGIDVKSAGTLLVGDTTATKVEISVAGVETEVQGTLDVIQAADFDAAITAGSTLAVTGVATFTAESVHNAGIDSDYITVDAGEGIDTKTAGTLEIGVLTANQINVGITAVETDILGTLNVTEAASFDAAVVADTTLGVTGVATFTEESVHNLGIDSDYITVDAGAGIDTKTAGTLLVGAATANKIEVGLTAVETEIQGTLDCVEGVTFQSAIFNAGSLPTSTNGLAAGRVWLNSNVLTITP